MLIKKLSGLAALACSMLPVGAMAARMTAAEQAIVDDANRNNRVLYISGSSSVQNGFMELITTLFSGTPIRFTNATLPSRDFEAVAGQLNSSAGTWYAGSNVIVVYRTKGGSVYGVNPVARNKAIEFMNVNSATCGYTGPAVDDTTPWWDISGGRGLTTDPYVCTTSSFRSPDAGVSDLHPHYFDGLYNTEGEVAAPKLTEGEQWLLANATPTYGLAFGVAVTKNVGLVRLNKATISAILTGNIVTWDQVDSTQSGDIVICRSVPGSEPVSNLYFGNYPCSSNAFNVPADRDSTSAWNDATNTYTVPPNTGSLVVIENSTASDVRNCLDKAVTGGTYITKDRDGNPVTVNFTAAGNKAVGVLSLDSLSRSKTTGNWQFRSLDGAGTYTWDTPNSYHPTGSPVASGTGKFPTLAAYETGDWDIHGVISFNLPARITGNKRALLHDLVSPWYSDGKAQDPAVIASLPNLKYVAAAIPGGRYTGPQVLDAVHANGDQCQAYNRNYND